MPRRGVGERERERERRGKEEKKLRPSLVVFCFSSFTGFFLLLLFALPLLVWFLSSDGYLSVDARSSREKRASEREREREREEEEERL